MADISLSSSMRQSLTTLKHITSSQEVQQLRLATGKRVNSAIDNPVNFFQSSGLSNRANDLGSLLDSIGQATKVIEAADKGIQSLTKLIESAQGSARQALQSTSTTAKITGSNTTALTMTSTLNSVGTANFATADTVTIAIGGGSAVTAFTADATDTVADVINGINNNTTLNPTSGPQKVKASLNDNGQIVVESLDGSNITVGGSALAKVNTLFGQTGTTALTATGTTNTTRSDMAKQFASLLTQIDQLSNDSGYNGINLLASGSLKVQFNEANTASITIAGVKFDSSGLGVSSATNNWQSDKDIGDAVNNLTTALTKLRSQSSTFGANLSVVQTRQDFTKGMVDTLQTGSDMLVLADQNEEAAKLLTLNTRQSLANTSLSLANQAQQGVMRLFG